MHFLCTVTIQGDLLLDMSERVIEFVIKLALTADKLNDVEIDPSDTLVHAPDPAQTIYPHFITECFYVCVEQ